jgi:hypothetical protein
VRGATENEPGAAREAVVWHNALDALAARLAAQAAFLGGEGAFPEGSWSPPAGPLPEGCRERAIVLLSQSLELERRFEATRRAATPAPASPYR